MEMKLGGDQKWRCNWEGVTKNGGVTVRDHKLRCNCEGGASNRCNCEGETTNKCITHHEGESDYTWTV